MKTEGVNWSERGRVVLQRSRSSTEWFLGTLVARTLEGHRRFPKGVWPHWLAIFASGVIFVAVLTAALTLFVRLYTAYGTTDWNAVLLRQFFENVSVSFVLAWVIDLPGQAWLAVLVTLLAAGIALWHRRPILALTFLAGYAVLELMLGLSRMLWERPIAVLDLGGDEGPLGMGSFPSEHVARAVFVFGMIATAWARSSPKVAERILATLLWIVIAVGVAIARLQYGDQLPSDIFGGAMIALAWLGIAAYAMSHVEHRAGIGVPHAPAPAPDSGELARGRDAAD